MEIIKEQPPAVYTLKLGHEDVYALYQELVDIRTFPDARIAPLTDELFDALRDALREDA